MEQYVHVHLVFAKDIFENINKKESIRTLQEMRFLERSLFWHYHPQQINAEKKRKDEISTNKSIYF
jgi:hypothetical protein